MSDLLRTFIAFKVKPESELLKILSLFKQELNGENIKWVDPGNMHLTLKFLGDTLPGQVSLIRTVLERVAGTFPVISFKLNGVGYFQRGRFPNVIFIKADNSELLCKLAEEIDNQLQEFGFPKEQKRFNPHLTIGRIKYLNDKFEFKRLVESYKYYQFQKEICREIIFYRSILKPQGAEYKSLAQFELR